MTSAALPILLQLAPGTRTSAEALHAEVAEYFSLELGLRRGATVVDVGANVGAFSLRAAAACDGELTLICVEPSPLVFASLRANFAAQPLLSRSHHHLLAMGLGDAAGAVSFCAFHRFPTNSTFDAPAKRREFEMFFEDRGRRIEAQLGRAARPFRILGEKLVRTRLAWAVMRKVMGAETVSVPVQRFSDAVIPLLPEHVSIDLLKVDVEGFELRVLEGIRPQDWPRIQRVVLETHDSEGRLEAIRRVLVEAGLKRIHCVAQKTQDNGLAGMIVVATR